MTNQELAGVNPEAHARLMGIMSQLGLPAMRYPDGSDRRIVVEIQIARGRWAQVHGVSVESDEITFWSGHNGTRAEYKFTQSEGCPPWRTHHGGYAAAPFITEV